MKAFNILPKYYGFSYDYDPRVNPNVINSFANAAYRLHTLIQVNKKYWINFIVAKKLNYFFKFKIRAF
jgi:hypothetical protein